MKLPEYFPTDVPIAFPENSSLPEADQHFLIYIPWDDKYLDFVPEKYRDFFRQILNHLSARTTNVHTAICMGYLNEFIEKAQKQGEKVNEKILAYALMLHDSGWSQMSEVEIAASLGVRGLALNETAMGPKEKHAVLGEQTARKILTEQQEKLELTDAEIDTICKAILFHDKPEEVANSQDEIPIEVKLLVDLDHIWSFTHLNFWQDTARKSIDPSEYLDNLGKDSNGYFVTEIGKEKARELLSQREKEVLGIVNAI